MTSRLFTSESVTEGHPDKICDAISDSILDELLRQDPSSRVAVETMVTTGQVHVAGEVTTSAYADIPAIVRDTVLGIGYDSSAKGFDGASCGVNVAIGAQSPDIAQGVDTAYESRVDGTVDELEQQGAGDQGLMFGYACTDTPELMPLPIALAHRLSRGLTGRKIIVDTYGGMARHGGGAFSGKDPSKVDRSAAYAMRWVAKNVVAAGLADRIEVQVAYAIGKASPVGLFVETFGTEQVDPDKIAEAIKQVFDLRPAAIIRDLDLKRPIYAQTAAYGHFGRTDVDLPWESTDRAADLKSALGM